MSYPDLLGACEGALRLRREHRAPEVLSKRIYEAVYAGGYQGSGSVPGADAPAVSFDSHFVQELMRRVPDRQLGDPWLLTARDSGVAHLEREGIRATVTVDRLPSEAVVGESVRVVEPALVPGRLPGFVCRYGTIELQGPITRLYINIQASAATWVLGDLARQLERLCLPFQMKVIAHPNAYYRADAGVIYAPSDAISMVVELCIDGIRNGQVRTGQLVPLLTHQVAPGLAVADEPNDIESSTPLSHGQWVTSLLVAALATAEDAAAMAKEVEAKILVAGRTTDTPYRRGRGPSGRISPGEDSGTPSQNLKRRGA
jgi:HopA1 effector protein family